MIQTPDWVRPKINTVYPPHNLVEFERWFYENYEGDVTDREYLPIFWTGYYVNNNYGNDAIAKYELQTYIDRLDRSKKYFTIIQYDDDILNDVSDLDLYRFSMSKTGENIYPLPLIGQPMPYIFKSEKKYLANFIGNVTHPIREHANSLRTNPDYYISFERHDPYDYCKIISESVFTLCYRGYGINSFRVAESLQYGSIPILVYTENDLIEPHNLNITNYGFAIPESALYKFDEIMNAFSELAQLGMFEYSNNIYQNYFTYEGTKDKILKHLLTLK